MSQTDPTQTDPTQTTPPTDAALDAAQASFDKGREAFGKVVERITPWLVEIGNWIFAGLIAAVLIVMAPLITIGPIDRAITIAALAFALALPLELAGLILLRLLQDTARIGLTNEWTQAFQDVGFPVKEWLASPQALKSRQTRRTNIVLLYALWILVLSVLLTLAGMTAALWHIAGWIGVIFCAMAIISLIIVIAALATLGPVESPEQKELNRRYWEEMMRQARERPRTNNKGAS